MPAIHNLLEPSKKKMFDISCNIVFVTFGNEKFKNSRERIVKSAENLGIFNKCHYETEDIVDDLEFKNALKNKEFNDVFSMSRGFGYWLWKPYVIYKNLKSLNDGDILVYSDAGIVIQTTNPILKLYNKQKFYNYFNQIYNNKGCLSFSTGPFPECKLNKGETLQYFNVYNNTSILKSDQLAAGFHIIRKCDFTTSVYNKWWTIAKENPGLFDDCNSRFENHIDFCENRHDQGVWSLLCKTMNIPLCKDNQNKRPFKFASVKN